MDTLIQSYPKDAVMLNIGAAETKLDPRIKNLEIEAGPDIDFVGTATGLPFDADTVDFILAQEVLEHVGDPFQAAREIHRVLKPGGKAFIQLPFTIGFHPCPLDYWRFSERGIGQLVSQAGFEKFHAGAPVGPATGA